MSRVVVIGATGHIGTYLVPRLVRAGHEGRRAEPWRARAVPGQPAVAPGQPGRRRPGRRGRGGALRRTCRRSASGRGDRPDLLHRRLGPAARRGAAPGPAAAGALRHDLGARPGAAGAGHRGRAADRLRRVRHGQGGNRGAAAPRDAGRRRALGRAAPRPHQRPRLARHHPGGQPRPRRLEPAGDRAAAAAARSRPRGAAPRACRRRGTGL